MLCYTRRKNPDSGAHILSVPMIRDFRLPSTTLLRLCPGRLLASGVPGYALSAVCSTEGILLMPDTNVSAKSKILFQAQVIHDDSKEQTGDL